MHVRLGKLVLVVFAMMASAVVTATIVKLFEFSFGFLLLRTQVWIDYIGHLIDFRPGEGGRDFGGLLH